MKAQRGQRLEMPSFYRPDETAKIWIEREALIAEEATQFVKEFGIPPASEDKKKIAVFGVDCQIGFVTPGASLQVAGAVDDMNRAIQFIYRNLTSITSLQFSLDTHRVFQIFHRACWVDGEGNNPPPFTAITTAAIREGRYRNIIDPVAAYTYCEILEREGKKALYIWPYHTMIGGVSHALVPAVQEAAMFHAMVRKNQTHYETKGTAEGTENYSVFEPEVKKINGDTVGEFNTGFFRRLMEHDAVYVWGEASSHCVSETLTSLEQKIMAEDPALIKRIYVLEDCMSPVGKVPGGPDFPAIAREANEHFRDVGMNIVKSTDPIVA